MIEEGTDQNIIDSIQKITVKTAFRDYCCCLLQALTLAENKQVTKNKCLSGKPVVKVEEHFKAESNKRNDEMFSCVCAKVVKNYQSSKWAGGWLVLLSNAPLDSNKSKMNIFIANVENRAGERSEAKSSTYHK